MSELESKAVEILDKLDNVISGYAPEVYESAIQAVRITAIGEFLSSIVMIIVAFFVIRYGIKLAQFAGNRVKNNDNKWEDGEIERIGITAICCLVSLIMLFACVCTLVNVWNYVAIFNPELALVHKITSL